MLLIRDIGNHDLVGNENLRASSVVEFLQNTLFTNTIPTWNNRSLFEKNHNTSQEMVVLHSRQCPNGKI